MEPTPVFLPGKSHGQMSLLGYIVHGIAEESDVTEQLTLTYTKLFYFSPITTLKNNLCNILGKFYYFLATFDY